MNKRGAGVLFCLMAAMLYAARYVAAAVYVSNESSWSPELFAAGLEYQGSGLLIFSVLSLVVGVCYLVWGELEARGKR